MTDQQLLSIQEGIWINRHWLQQAGLGERLQVIIQPGEIRISAAPEATEPLDSSEVVWTEEAIEVFHSLGRDAVPGQLKDTSTHHDLYLYGKTE